MHADFEEAICKRHAVLIMDHTRCYYNQLLKFVARAVICCSKKVIVLAYTTKYDADDMISYDSKTWHNRQMRWMFDQYDTSHNGGLERDELRAIIGEGCTEEAGWCRASVQGHNNSQ